MEVFSYFMPNGVYWRNRDVKQALCYFSVICLVMIGIFFCFWPSSSATSKEHVKVRMESSDRGSLNNLDRPACVARDVAHEAGMENCADNHGELSKPLVSHKWIEFNIAIVSDLDEDKSKVPGKKNTWRSFFKEGVLRKHFDGKYSVEWKKENIVLTSKISEKGRGLELSELAMFHGKLYTVDDRTGIVYQIKNGKVIQWVILPDGDGSVSKGFKGEWMTVKDNTLYVGGLGKEWTTPTGELVNFNPQFVKSIGPSGDVVHHNWRNVYERVKTELGIVSPGYVIHEAVTWSSTKRRWFFLPRRASHEKYDDQSDERRATNVLLSCNESFEDFTVVKIGEVIPTHGFSSFKFVPGTNDNIIVALRSVEDAGKISTYFMVFKVDGTIILDETFIDNDKFEGIEFL